MMDDFDAFIFKGMLFVVGCMAAFVFIFAFLAGPIGFAVFTGTVAVMCFSGLAAMRIFRS